MAVVYDGGQPQDLTLRVSRGNISRIRARSGQLGFRRRVPWPLGVVRDALLKAVCANEKNDLLLQSRPAGRTAAPISANIEGPERSLDGDGSGGWAGGGVFVRLVASWVCWVVLGLGGG